MDQNDKGQDTDATSDPRPKSLTVVQMNNQNNCIDQNHRSSNADTAQWFDICKRHSYTYKQISCVN